MRKIPTALYHSEYMQACSTVDAIRCDYTHNSAIRTVTERLSGVLPAP